MTGMCRQDATKKLITFLYQVNMGWNKTLTRRYRTLPPSVNDGERFAPRFTNIRLRPRITKEDIRITLKLVSERNRTINSQTLALNITFSAGVLRKISE